MTKQFFWKIILFILTLVAGTVLFIYLIWKQGLDGVLESVSSFGFLAFLGFVGLSLLNFVLYSWRWQIILNEQLPKEKHLPLHKIFMNRLAGFSVSYLTPAAQVGGEPVRIAMLNADGVPLKQATSSVLLDITFELTAYIAFIMAGVILALVEGFADNSSLWIIFVGIGIALVGLIAIFAALASGKDMMHRTFHFFRLNKIKRLHKFDRGLRDTERMMTKFLHGKPSLILLVSVLSFSVIAFRVIEAYYIAHFLGFDLNFAQSFLIATLPGVALLLPVPGGLGVFEGGFAALFAILVIPLNAVAFALVIRARDVVFILFGGIHILRKGKTFIGDKIFKGAK